MNCIPWAYVDTVSWGLSECSHWSSTDAENRAPWPEYGHQNCLDWTGSHWTVWQLGHREVLRPVISQQAISLRPARWISCQQIYKPIRDCGSTPRNVL